RLFAVQAADLLQFLGLLLDQFLGFLGPFLPMLLAFEQFLLRVLEGAVLFQQQLVLLLERFRAFAKLPFLLAHFLADGVGLFVELFLPAVIIFLGFQFRCFAQVLGFATRLHDNVIGAFFGRRAAAGFDQPKTPKADGCSQN